MNLKIVSTGEQSDAESAAIMLAAHGITVAAALAEVRREIPLSDRPPRTLEEAMWRRSTRDVIHQILDRADACLLAS